MDKNTSRTPTILRARRARDDASVGSIQGEIESVFGLPEGSVKLCDPSGRRVRADCRIGTLRRKYSQMEY